MAYFVYSTHKTLAKAEVALDDYHTTGEISESEHPYVERRRVYLSVDHRDCSKGYRYCVMFPS
jgi:hypothetical protein